MANHRVLLAALLGCSAATSATLARFPYVQNVNDTQATIIWTTLERGRGTVEFSSDGARWQTALAQGQWFSSSDTGVPYNYVQHEARLAGLRPATRYMYRVSVDGEMMPSQGLMNFRTAGPGAFRFLVFGDSGTGSAPQRRVADRMSSEEFDFVLHTGDVVYPAGAFVHYQPFYFDPYAAMLLRAPFFPSLGNHDYDTRSGAPYLAVHVLPTDGVPESGRERYYSFDWSNAHFVAVDTNAPLAAASRGEGPMLDWLAADLARTKKFWRFVFFHHPAYSMGAYQNDARTRLVRDHLAPILERHGVHIAFHGHEHSYQRSFPISDGNAASTGTLYITTGGGGASLYTVDVGPRTAFALSAHHYLRVSVDGVAATMEAVREDGQIFDRVDLAPAPRLSNPAVVNAASFVPSVAPGSLVTIFGRDIADEPATGGSMAMELRGVRVTLDGQRLPLSYVSPTQINTQLPYGAFGSTVLRVSTPNGSADAILSLSDTAPAVFLVNGRPAATHPDGTLISPGSPAVPGEVISIYVTGLGRVSGVISAGQTAPTRPLMVTRAEVEVEIAGTRVDPHFAGLAPGYAGLYQINVLMPAVRSGDQMLRIHAGPSKSPPVSLAVGSP